MRSATEKERDFIAAIRKPGKHAAAIFIGYLLIAIVAAIYIEGRRYTVLEAEPVWEGTKVRITYLPNSGRIVSLERFYDL